MSVHRHSWKVDDNPEKKPTVAIVRYGAFGDLIQTLSVCAQFKKQGYHVTVYCSYPASEVAAKDPNIDVLIPQFPDQVPMQWLGHYWAWLAHKGRHGKPFDKFVNLTEAVETNLLATLGTIKFAWPPKARHITMDFNYLEHKHLIAGVPYEPSFKFHPTEQEAKWWKEERERMRKAGIKKFMLWALAGSSRHHKIYPYIDILWKHVLTHYTEWGVVTAGDGSCAELEANFEGHQKIWKTSGKWTIRQVLTALEDADVVVGPETGVLNAAAFYSMPKVIFLSHSSIENLTRDWVNTTSFYAPYTCCPGRGNNEVVACHRMLPSFEGCLQNKETGSSQCVSEIKPEWVWGYLQQAMNTGVAEPWNPPIIASSEST